MIPFEFEIFAAGPQTDSLGRKREFTEADLEQAAGNYDKALHEAPLCIGHPKDNMPAYGWVHGMKRAGRKLLAYGEALPEFIDMVKRGLFKKRSASFYPDFQGKGLYLNHVAFLGAQPPAVKGLADIAFADDGQTETYEFHEKETHMAFEEKFTEFVETLKDLLKKAIPAAQKTEFTEEQLQAKVDEKAAALVAAAKTEFAEQLKTEKDKAQKLQRESAKAGIVAFCENLKKEGKLLPAWESLGLVEFMLSLDSDEALEFAEGAEKLSRAGFMQKLLSELPKVVEFKEKTGREKTGEGATAADKLEALVKQKMADKKDLSYAMAFAEVQAEHGDLATQYAEEIAPK